VSIVLKDIDFNKRKVNNYSENKAEMYTLHEYRNIAKRCISLFAEKPSSYGMIKNEDAIAHVAEHIMWGHMRWREDGGRTLKSYLNQCAIWSIKVWKTKIYQTDKKKELSLNHTICNSSGSESEQYKIIADKKSKTPEQIIFENKRHQAKELIDDKCLTNLQNKCLELRYIDGKKLQEIADEMGVSKQAINQHIKKGIKKLRERNNGVC